jgi:hypothetical protein
MGNKDDMLEQEHNEFIKNETFCQMIKEKIEHSHYHKYDGLAPEGFLLIPEQTLERLKDFDYWKEWKYDQTNFKKDMMEDTKNM